jgi:hypothetical protein
MADPPPDRDQPGNGKQDERVSIPLPFEDAMRGLLAVDPEQLPDEPNGKPEKRPKKRETNR